jgi:hypothetical protein
VATYSVESHVVLCCYGKCLGKFCRYMEVEGEIEGEEKRETEKDRKRGREKMW